jgi:hypothetical protein
MIRPHADDYRPPRDGPPSLLFALCQVAGVAVAIAGSIALLVRLISWLLK